MKETMFSYFAAVTTPSNLPQYTADTTTVQNVFNVILALAGATAVAFIVFGGIKYILSQGEPAKVNAAREAILYACIGLIVVMLSFVLVNYVIGRF